MCCFLSSTSPYSGRDWLPNTKNPTLLHPSSLSCQPIFDICWLRWTDLIEDTVKCQSMETNWLWRGCWSADSALSRHMEQLFAEVKFLLGMSFAGTIPWMASKQKSNPLIGRKRQAKSDGIINVSLFFSSRNVPFFVLALMLKATPSLLLWSWIIPWILTYVSGNRKKWKRNRLGVWNKNMVWKPGLLLANLNAMLAGRRVGKLA